ncbi:MAG: DoxX family membrane protein [Desulfovibrio sp.]|nr:MAG: DoxX family membrane protein [Desulfovibrio sp.]
MNLVRRVLCHPVLALLFRLYIGGVFVAAGMNKIIYTGEFAHTIASYRLVPYWGVNLMAIWLPWFEFLAGAMLIAGLRVRPMALAIAGMLAWFCLAVGINLLRGTPIDCGCFSSMEDPMSVMTLLRDLLWLGMALHVYFFDRWLHLERSFSPKLKDLPQ